MGRLVLGIIIGAVFDDYVIMFLAWAAAELALMVS